MENTKKNKKKNTKNKTGELSPRNRKFAAMLANVDEYGDFTVKQFADALNIGVATVSRWKKDPKIIELSIKLSNDSLKKYLPKVNSMIVNKALEGNDVTAANTFYKRVDRQALDAKGFTELTPDQVLLLIRNKKSDDSE